MELNQIMKQLKSGAILSPSQIAEFHRTVTGIYSYESSEFIRLEQLKNEKTEELRKDTKSDSSAERQFYITTDGKEYLRLKYKLRVLEKILSSLKLSADTAKTEFFNQKTL